MLRLRISLATGAVTVLVLACSTAKSTAAADEPTRRSWKTKMHQVGLEVQSIEDQLQSPGFGDLKKVAAAATRTAELVAQGYGPLQQQDVPGFADRARETETWLLQIAMEASLDHGELVRELYRQKETNYCTKCHVASDQIHPRPRR